jgi:hypothetical protein
MFLEFDDEYFVLKESIESVRFLLDFNKNKTIRIRTKSGAEHYREFATAEERQKFLNKIIKGEK